MKVAPSDAGNVPAVDAAINCSKTRLNISPSTQIYHYGSVESTIAHENVHKKLSHAALVRKFSTLVDDVEDFDMPISRFESAQEAADWFKDSADFEGMVERYSHQSFTEMGGAHNGTQPMAGVL